MAMKLETKFTRSHQTTKNVRSYMFVSIYRIQSDEFAVVIMEKLETDGPFNQVRGLVSSFVFSNINDKVFVCNENEISLRATVGVSIIIGADSHEPYIMPTWP